MSIIQLLFNPSTNYLFNISPTPFTLKSCPSTSIFYIPSSFTLLHFSLLFFFSISNVSRILSSNVSKKINEGSVKNALPNKTVSSRRYNQNRNLEMTDSRREETEQTHKGYCFHGRMLSLADCCSGTVMPRAKETHTTKK